MEGNYEKSLHNITDNDIHVGFVYALACDEQTGDISEITVIEGNLDNKVESNIYKFDEADIIGYGESAINPYTLEQHTITSEPADDGASAIISGNIPRGAFIKPFSAVGGKCTFTRHSRVNFIFH